MSVLTVFAYFVLFALWAGIAYIVADAIGETLDDWFSGD